MIRTFIFQSLCLVLIAICSVGTASAERLSDLGDMTDLTDLDSLLAVFVDSNPSLRDTCVFWPEPVSPFDPDDTSHIWSIALGTILCFDSEGETTLSFSVYIPDSLKPSPSTQLNCSELIARAGEELSHEFCVEGDPENIEWKITPRGSQPAGEFDIDFDGTFRFVPDVIDENRKFEFQIQRSDGPDTSECSLGVTVQQLDRYFPLDTDGNGVVDIDDIVFYSHYPSQLDGLFNGMTEEQKKAFDCNRDGVYPSIADIQFAVDCVFDTRGRYSKRDLSDSVNVKVESGSVRIESESVIQNLMLIFSVGADHTIDSYQDRIHVFEEMNSLRAVTVEEPMSGDILLRIDGDIGLVHCEASDRYGRICRSIIVTDDSTWTVQYPFDFERLAE